MEALKRTAVATVVPCRHDDRRDGCRSGRHDDRRDGRRDNRCDGRRGGRRRRVPAPRSSRGVQAQWRSGSGGNNQHSQAALQITGVTFGRAPFSMLRLQGGRASYCEMGCPFAGVKVLEEIISTPDARFGAFRVAGLLPTLPNIEKGAGRNVTLRDGYGVGASPDYFHRIRTPLRSSIFVGCVLEIWLGEFLLPSRRPSRRSS